MSSNKAVPKTYIYGLAVTGVGPTGQDASFVPVICNGEGAIYVATAPSGQGGTPLNETNTSRTPSTDDVNPTSPGNIIAADVASFNYLFNEYRAGGTFSRARSNENPIVLASAARTATVDSATFLNENARGAHFVVNVTAVTATPSIVVKIQGQDPANLTEFYDILVSNAITTIGRRIFKVYPGINSVSNAATSDILPWGWRVRVEHDDTDSITYSVAANLVL